MWHITRFPDWPGRSSSAESAAALWRQQGRRDNIARTEGLRGSPTEGGQRARQPADRASVVALRGSREERPRPCSGSAHVSQHRPRDQRPRDQPVRPGSLVAAIGGQISGGRPGLFGGFGGLDAKAHVRTVNVDDGEDSLTYHDNIPHGQFHFAGSGCVQTETPLYSRFTIGNSRAGEPGDFLMRKRRNIPIRSETGKGNPDQIGLFRKVRSSSFPDDFPARTVQYSHTLKRCCFASSAVPSAAPNRFC